MLGRIGRRRVVASAAIVAALVIPAAFAFAHGDEEHQAAADNEPAMVTTDSGQLVPRESQIDFCPTLEQSEKHLEVYGFDYKPTVPCGGSVEFKESGDEHADSEPVNGMTLEMAQALYDPGDDPNILIGRGQKPGEFSIIHIHPVDPIPAYVRTEEQFLKWARGND